MMFSRCVDEKISYDIIKRLNYRDLQAIIIEREIRSYEQELRRLAKNENESKGRNIRKASAKDIAG